MEMMTCKSSYIKPVTNLNDLFNLNSSVSMNGPSFLMQNSTLSSERSLPISKSVNRINYNYDSSLSDLTEMIDRCRMNKVLSNNYYDSAGYLNIRGASSNRKNNNDLFHMKKEYLLTETPKTNNKQRESISSYKNSSRLKDKINELIELSNSKVITQSEHVPQGKAKNNEGKEKPKKKTLSEQRKDIFNILTERSTSNCILSPVKNKFKFKALEIEASPYIIRNHSKVNSFANNSSRATTINTNESVLNTSNSCTKINLINKMIDMKLNNNHLYKKNSNLFLVSSNRKNNVLVRKSENEFRIKNKIKEITKFKFSKNYNERKNPRENEIKENNLQIISMIKDNIDKDKKKNSNHHKRRSTYEEIDINIDFEPNSNKVKEKV